MLTLLFDCIIFVLVVPRTYAVETWVTGSIVRQDLFFILFFLALHSQRKQVLMKDLLTPIASKFTIILSRLNAEQDEKTQQAYANCLNNSMSLAR